MTTATRTSRFELFGLDVDALDAEATLDRVFELAESGEPSQHVALNAAKVVLAQKDGQLRDIITAATS